MKRAFSAGLVGAFGFGVALNLQIVSASAGEIGGGIGSCDTSSPLLGCTWKSKSCLKPDPPSVFVTDVDSYNLAVSEFNSYLDEVRSYEDCIIAEAKRDVSE